jgi:hypothetical protein
MNKEKLINNLNTSGIAFLGGASALALLVGFLFIFNRAVLYTNISYSINEYLVKDDLMVDIISDRCSLESSDRGKMYCVYNIFNSFYRYELRGADISGNYIHDMNYHTPTTTLIEGGLCRDAAVLYCAVFKKLNIDCRYSHIDNHVFNVIDFGNGDYCIIDQHELRC